MKHLIFDCGGVLVYPRLGTWFLPCAMPGILGERMAEVETPKFREALAAAMPWLDESRHVSSLDEERGLRLEYLKALDAGMGWGLSPGTLNLLADDFTHNIERYGFFEDAKPWIRRWKRTYALGILSDAMPSLSVFLKQYGLLELFDAAVFSCEVGAIKPDERMFEAILGALKAEPRDCLFVDDRADNLKGALRLGMKAVQMCRAEFPPEKRWDGPVAEDFEALNNLLTV